MKRLLIILGVVVLVLGGLMAPAFAEGSGEVDVTVTVAEPSITVNPTSVDYGLVNLNASMVAPLGDQRIMVENVGNCFVDLRIKGADTTNWDLWPMADNERYVHYWSMGPPDTPTFYPLSLNYQEYDNTVSNSPGTTTGFSLRMDTPTQSAYFGQQSTTVTVMAIMVTEGITLDLAIDPTTSFSTVGGETATLTATVRDQDNQLVSGIPLDRFRAYISGIPSEETPVTTWTEPDSSGNPGVYQGTLIMPALAAGNYTMRVWTRADLPEGSAKGTGYDDFAVE